MSYPDPAPPQPSFARRLLPFAIWCLILAGASAVAIRTDFFARSSPAPLPTIAAPSAGSDDLYVSGSGSDAATGTSDDPLRTIQAALAEAMPGSTIWLASGSYEGFAATASGTEGNPITIAGLAGATATIEPGGRASTIDLSGAHDIRLVNLSVSGPTGQALDGIRLNRSSRIEIAGSSIHGANGGFGIEVRFSDNVTIRGNDIAHNAVGVRLYGEGDPGSVHDVLIEQNAIHDSDSMVVNDPAPDNDFGANGIIWHKVTGMTIARDNQVWNNRASSHDYGTDGGAFEVWGSSNLEVTGNTTWGNVNVMETGSDGPPCAHITFTDNIARPTSDGVGLILRCASDGLFAHNVIDRVSDYAFELSDSSGDNPFANSIEGLRIEDNIVVGTRLYAIRNHLPDSVVLDYNLGWQTGGSYAQVQGHGDVPSLAELYRVTGYEKHGISADPRFVDEASGDYRLSPGSAAVDRGVALSDTEQYLGQAPDIGPYEGFVPLPSPS